MARCPGPQLLRPDNFTPVSRTPWGGRRLRSGIKAGCPVRAGRASQLAVGESWEVSVEPDFPAELDDGTPLSAWLAEHTTLALGEEAARGRQATALLVKLLDTAEPLSLQIHPADDYAGLAGDQSGKPESWYVVHAEPNAGLYLGFDDGVRRADVERALAEGGALDRLLRFVPVQPGDFFVIDAGTPHAIGPGLTLVEPQHVVPGKRGVTYRYWDWNRRYDADGLPAPEGQPRALHVQDALAVTDWTRVSEARFVQAIRHRAGPAEVASAARLDALCGPQGTVDNKFLQVWRAAGEGTCALPTVPFLRGISVLEGRVWVRGPDAQLLVERGRSAVIPACLEEAELVLERGHAILACVA